MRLIINGFGEIYICHRRCHRHRRHHLHRRHLYAVVINALRLSAAWYSIYAWHACRGRQNKEYIITYVHFVQAEPVELVGKSLNEYILLLAPS